MTSSRLNLIETSPDVQWQVVQQAEKRKSFTETSYSERMTNTAAGTLYREVYKRTKKATYGQLSLGDLGDSVRFDCIATNDFTREPSEVFDFYNGRANIENNIKELKQDYALGKIVTESFDANDVITQVTLLTYLFVQHLKEKTFPPQLRKQTLSTIRNRLFNIPSSLFREGRQTFLRIQNVFASTGLYAQILVAFKNMLSWLVEPPDLTI